MNRQERCHLCNYLGIVLTGEAVASLGDGLTVAVLVTLTLGRTVVTDVAEVTLTLVGGHAVPVGPALLFTVGLTLVTVGEKKVMLECCNMEFFNESCHS